jgi:triacylglycerol lipase
MLARLEQFTTLGSLLLAAVWGLWAWQAGHPGWALAGALLVLGLYALVLGFEFLVLVPRLNAGDAVPHAGFGQRLGALCGEVLHAPLVFCWRQPFRSTLHADHLPANAMGKRGVVLVHGFVCNRGLWNRWLPRLRAQGVPVVAVNLEPVFGSIERYANIVDAAVAQVQVATGLAPVVVGHSMGGLALRRWWAGLGDAAHARVHRAITIGSPHHGTWLGRLAFSRNGQEMRQDSAWLQALQAAEPPGRYARFTCFYSHCDNIVLPASTAALPGADNRHLPGQAHMMLVDAPEPWDELQRWLK